MQNSNSLIENKHNYQRGKEGRKDTLEIWINRYKLPYIK